MGIGVWGESDNNTGVFGHSNNGRGVWGVSDNFIATVGDSGGRSQPGLYLEIRRGATPVDPVPWFRRPAP